MKNINLNWENVLKRPENCIYRFLGMLITMYCVRTLFIRYFLRWFLLIFDRKRFRHRVLKHGVGVEWDARGTAA